MQEESLNDMDQESTAAPTELELLQKRANLMGIKYHPHTGVDKLRLKVQAALDTAAMEAEEAPVEPVEATTSRPATIAKPAVKLSPEVLARQRKMQLREDAARLVRINVVCMNPNKKNWEGEVYSAGNGVIGMFKKYVPFNTTDGWHVPNIIYKHLMERECQVFQTVKGPRGNKIRKGKLIREFSIDLLPALTPAELKQLATQQAMANNID
jgi:hypothetical protein